MDFFKKNKFFKFFICSIPFLISTELILGNWLYPKPKVSQLPSGLYDVQFRYKYPNDWTLYQPKKITTYTRNDLGYRGWDSEFSSVLDANFILTIGSSTTDQRFEDDSATWSEMMEKYLLKRGIHDIEVINGAISGHTTLGYLKAIENWHNFDLAKIKPSIKAIVFEMNISEIKYLAKDLNLSFDIEAESGKKKQSLKDQLKLNINRNSFLYKYVRSIKHTMKNVIENGNKYYLPPNDTLRNWRFDDFEKEVKYTDVNKEDIEKYSNLFKKLLNTTSILFPDSRIVITQAYMPACNFDSDEYIIQKIPEFVMSKAGTLWVENSCNLIKKIYEEQELIINSLNKERVDNILVYNMSDHINIDHNGYYDIVHPVGVGSKYIGNNVGNFIFENLFSID